MTRLDDPYVGVRRASGFANLWFGPIEGSQHGEGLLVVYSHWIFEEERRLRCDNFGSLRRPV